MSSSHLYKHMSEANFLGLFEKGLEMPLQSSACSKSGHAWPCPGAALCCLVCLCTTSRWSSSSIHLLPPSLKNKPSFLLSSLQPKKPSTLQPTPPHLLLVLGIKKKMFSFQRCRHFLAYEKLFPS